MLQINPNQKFNFSRQLDNVGDSTTYYLQAVVRYNSNNSILATVNMTDKGSQRFIGSFTPPNDPGGNGYDISITTSVYTDSGYSQLSPTYSTVGTDYRVQLNFSPAFGYGGGGGIDLKILRRIIQEELEDLKKKKIPEPLKSEEVKKLVADLFIPYSKILESHLLYMRDGFNKSNLAMEYLSKSKTKSEKEMIDGFRELLLANQGVLKKDNDAYILNLRSTIDSFVNSLKDYFKEEQAKNRKFSESKWKEMFGKVDEASTSHFNELISQFNKDGEEKKSKLSQLIEDIFKSRKILEPKKEPMVDYLAKAKKLLNY